MFQDLKENRAAIWGLFFMSGYLKVLSSEFGEYGNKGSVIANPKI